MPDPIEPAVVETPAATVVEPPAVETPTPSDEVEKWKALSRKNEQRAKENEAAAKRLAELEEANKTELEKAQARAAAAEKTAAEAVAAKLRTDVANTKGIPSELFAGPASDSLEDLATFADVLLAFKGTIPAAPPATPQGQVGEIVNASDPDIDAAIAAAQKARNFPLVATLKQQKAAKKG